MFLHEAFLKKKKDQKKKKGETRPDATVVPRRRDQWQLNAHRLDSLNYVTTRSNGLESLQSRTRSSMHVTVETRFSQEREFLKKIQMIIFEQNHPSYFCSKFFHPSKSSLGFFLGQNLPRKSFFWKKWGWKNSKNWKQIRKEEKQRQTQQAQQKKGQLTNRKEFFTKRKKVEKNQQEIKEFFLRTHFSKKKLKRNFQMK